LIVEEGQSSNFNTVDKDLPQDVKPDLVQGENVDTKIETPKPKAPEENLEVEFVAPEDKVDIKMQDNEAMIQDSSADIEMSAEN